MSDLLALAEPLKRSWRGRFIKRLRMTPEDSREWLIWSRYHGAWHRRSADGGACGYTNDIAQAGLFVRAKANSYNDGDRNEAFHVSERVEQLLYAREQLEIRMENVTAALTMASALAAKGDA